MIITCNDTKTTIKPADIIRYISTLLCIITLFIFIIASTYWYCLKNPFPNLNECRRSIPEECLIQNIITFMLFVVFNGFNIVVIYICVIFLTSLAFILLSIILEILYDYCIGKDIVSHE